MELLHLRSSYDETSAKGELSRPLQAKLKSVDSSLFFDFGFVGDV